MRDTIASELAVFSNGMLRQELSRREERDDMLLTRAETLLRLIGLNEGIDQEKARQMALDLSDDIRLRRDKER